MLVSNMENMNCEKLMFKCEVAKEQPNTNWCKHQFHGPCLDSSFFTKWSRTIDSEQGDFYPDEPSSTEADRWVLYLVHPSCRG